MCATLVGTLLELKKQLKSKEGMSTNDNSVITMNLLLKKEIVDINSLKRDFCR